MKINNKKELMQELLRIYNDTTKSKEENVFAIGLLYLVFEFVSDDRTTEHIMNKWSELSKIKK